MKYSKKEAAICGLFCPACSIYIGTTEDPKRLEQMSKMFNTPIEEMKCYGCRSDIRISYCDNCSLEKCAIEKGIDFCGQCPDYPCSDIKEFQAAGAHRFDLWDAQEKIKKEGYEKWMEEMIEHYSCPKCNSINSAYDPKCRSCGNVPSNQYVAEHGQEIIDFLKNNQTRLKSD
jgi:hypothetical protein